MTQLAKPARRLPPELISGILSYLELHDLYGALATSRDWRRVALDHPTYWRSVHLPSTSDGAIDLFLSRLAHSRQRKIRVRIDASQSCRRISDDVLPAIANRLHRIWELCITVHHDQSANLFAVLHIPAPVLERFQVCVVSPVRMPLAVLPPSVFCGTTPKLTFVGFRDVGVSDVTYPAFTNVVDVDFGFTRSETFHVVPLLFSVFPRMRRLGLHSGSLDVPANLQFRPTIPADIEAVECVMTSQSLGFMVGVLPYHAILSVSVTGAEGDTVEFLIGQLPGELAMEITDQRHLCPELFDITVTSTETGFRRTFGQSARRYLAGVKPPICFLRDHEFAERVTALTVPNTLWGFLARHFLPFPNLKELTVRLDTPHVPVLGSAWAVSCAKLQMLRLVANTVDPLYVSTERLAAFVVLSLADLPSSARPALELDAAILEGDHAVLIPHLRLPGEADAPSSRPLHSRTLTSRCARV